jgi:recombinational DNA repair protein RecR
LPGIGKKTALRLVLHLLKLDPSEVERFSENLVEDAKRDSVLFEVSQYFRCTGLPYLRIAFKTETSHLRS